MNPSQGNLNLAAALSHPTRVRILMAMNAPRRCLSPKLFSEEVGNIELSHASHHFAKLNQWGFIELAYEKRGGDRRGATEHFYEPVKKALTWSKEAASLPPNISDSIASTGLRGFVEDVGGAIDSGHFSDRPDRVVAYDKMWVDKQGWADLVAMMAKALKTALKIENECVERKKAQGSREDFFCSTYSLVLFESFPPPGTTDKFPD
jgi:DNA-binding transcriptional ArsR family regulator